MSDIHPAPSEFNDAEIATDHVLRYFRPWSPPSR